MTPAGPAPRVRIPRARRSLLVAELALAAAAGARAEIVLIGLDGASWNVVDPLLEAGELPNFAAIAAAGVTAELETVEPTLSPVAWTSIATGRTPANHGVRDFFSTALSIRTPTVFERLAARGLRVGLYDYLMTWPPVDLPEGFVIPGWLRRDESVSPPDVWGRIEASAWTNAYDPLKTSEDYRRNAMSEIRHKPSRWNQLAAAFDLDVGGVVFYAPDGVSHRFWHGEFPGEFEPRIARLATGIQRTAIRDVMRGLDRAVGEIRSRLAPEDTLIIVSDHGFQRREEPSDFWVGHVADALEPAGLEPARDGFAILLEFGRLVIRVHPGSFAKAEDTTERLVALIEAHETLDGRGLFWSAEVLDFAPRPPGAERSLGNRIRQWLVRRVLEWALDVHLAMRTPRCWRSPGPAFSPSSQPRIGCGSRAGRCSANRSSAGSSSPATTPPSASSWPSGRG